MMEANHWGEARATRVAIERIKGRQLRTQTIDQKDRGSR